MKYYYLEGVEKKGPYLKEELMLINLNSSTLIFCEGMKNWTQLNQIPELNKTDNLSVELDSKKPKKFKIYGVFFLIIALFTTTGISFIYTQSQIDKDFQDFEKKVQEIFQGKDEICDFKNEEVKGKLQKHPGYNDGYPIYEYFEVEAGGWNVLTLTKVNGGFNLVESNSKNMGFKVSQTKKSFGYNIPTNRGTVQNAYNLAAEHISKKKENNSYIPGTYQKIKFFNKLSSDFHSIENIEAKIYSEEVIGKKSWYTTDADVSNAKWIVWLNTNGKHYKIVENEELFNAKWLKYSLISGLVAVLIFVLLRYRKKITIQVV